MISSNAANRVIFVFSLAGLMVSSFLLYEYNLQGPIICPTGAGCDTVRASPYSHFLGISMPILGVVFYLVMAIFSVMHAQTTNNLLRSNKLALLFRLKLLVSIIGVGFGVYLTFLEIFVIKAICFWCVLSFIISCVILLSVILGHKNNDNRN